MNGLRKWAAAALLLAATVHGQDVPGAVQGNLRRVQDVTPAQDTLPRFLQGDLSCPPGLGDDTCNCAPKCNSAEFKVGEKCLCGFCVTEQECALHDDCFDNCLFDDDPHLRTVPFSLLLQPSIAWLALYDEDPADNATVIFKRGGGGKGGKKNCPQNEVLFLDENDMETRYLQIIKRLGDGGCATPPSGKLAKDRLNPEVCTEVDGSDNPDSDICFHTSCSQANLFLGNNFTASGDGTAEEGDVYLELVGFCIKYLNSSSGEETLTCSGKYNPGEEGEEGECLDPPPAMLPPTDSPTTSPTKNPTESPTESPTKNPTTSPTVSPTNDPTTSPTVSPTKNPTTSPTVSPTNDPTTSPTKNPTTSPTVSPTKNPTTSPTVSPTKNPTTSPTVSPTKDPTTSPTVSPTKSPTTSPTVSPTKSPTTSPTLSPTKNPIEASPGGHCPTDPAPNTLCMCGECVSDSKCIPGPDCGLKCGGGCKWFGPGKANPGSLTFQICPPPATDTEVTVVLKKGTSTELVEDGGLVTFGDDNLEPEADFFLPSGQGFYVHTSCSQELYLGAKFASVGGTGTTSYAILVGYRLKKSGDPGITNVIGPYDCDSIEAGDTGGTCAEAHVGTGIRG